MRCIAGAPHNYLMTNDGSKKPMKSEGIKLILIYSGGNVCKVNDINFNRGYLNSTSASLKYC